MGRRLRHGCTNRAWATHGNAVVYWHCRFTHRILVQLVWLRLQLLRVLNHWENTNAKCTELSRNEQNKHQRETPCIISTKEALDWLHHNALLVFLPIRALAAAMLMVLARPVAPLLSFLCLHLLHVPLLQGRRVLFIRHSNRRCWPHFRLRCNASTISCQGPKELVTVSRRHGFKHPRLLTCDPHPPGAPGRLLLLLWVWLPPPCCSCLSCFPGCSLLLSALCKCRHTPGTATEMARNGAWSSGIKGAVRAHSAGVIAIQRPPFIRHALPVLALWCNTRWGPTWWRRWLSPSLLLTLSRCHFFILQCPGNFLVSEEAAQHSTARYSSEGVSSPCHAAAAVGALTCSPRVQQSQSHWRWEGKTAGGTRHQCIRCRRECRPNAPTPPVQERLMPCILRTMPAVAAPLTSDTLWYPKSVTNKYKLSLCCAGERPRERRSQGRRHIDGRRRCNSLETR